MKKQNGITLIALVISIIVMLILAGVSINAIVSENGVLSRAQYSSFMNEMTAVEEAVQMWKAGELIESKGKVNTAIPVNGLCKINDLINTERLVGEVGYYRNWSIGNKIPDTNILSSAEVFNKKFEGEFVYYPSGVQDLYYLNNEALDLDKKKVYLIDAATSMIYSATGITLNGVRCYSTNMVKAVMGNNISPVFAEAEMSGGGDNIIYAGETYLKDKNGNYVDEKGNIVSEENKVLNPNGFQIISHSSTNNIFKLYNDGTLYGKGVKGIQLNSSVEEMEKINAYQWNEFTLPDNISKVGVKKILPGEGTIYIIDKAGDLWAWGNNTNNKLGLTEEQQIEYTGREAIKLDLYGKSVKEVYKAADITFVITEDNLLYVSGKNTYGALGLGYKSSETEKFMQVNISNVENIKRIMPNSYASLIWYEDNTFYAAGTNRNGWIFSTGSTSQNYLKTFTRIYDGNIGTDVDQDIKDILYCSPSTMILKNDGTIWQVGHRGADGTGGGGDLSGSLNLFEQFPENFGSNVTAIYQVGSGRIITRINEEGEIELWGNPGGDNNLGLGEETYNSTKFFKITIPNDLKNEGIKEIFTTENNVYYLGNSGKVYVSGLASKSGLNLASGRINEIAFSGLDNIKTLYSTEIVHINNASGLGCASPLCFTGNDNKIYTIGNSEIVFRDNILQTTWKEVAKDVKYFDASGAGYVDKDNNLWIAGSNSKVLGLGKDSENSKPINNYILHTDSQIQGRVAEVSFAGGITVVRTTNNELWVTGIYESNGHKYYPGWEEEENKTTFVKILDDIAIFAVYGDKYGGRIAISNSGVVYGWGANYGGVVGHTTQYSSVPIEFELSSTAIGNIGIKSVGFNCSGYKSHLITETGKLFFAGKHTGYTGGHSATAYFSEYTYNLNLQENEKIMKLVSSVGNSALILTDMGRMFGYGPANKLGIGNVNSDNIETQILSIDNVSQIVAGKGFYVAIKNDGTVWGTGSNINGILGRWIGIDRNSPNSRYKTAFEWVECPELEI